ncbi:Transposase, Mutator family [Cryptosporangium aurantiacum]|uniref:Transposase, Mutator family n=1 Tax=Cryptosporangium aurantiacum TaxID=134849 RepID=A0A1M7RFK4_9ACTN|nr:Transposase, Mutator family [Cryptosporangium aurantiacum]
MALLEGLRAQIAARLAALLPHLNERQRRLLLGVEARLLGHGGVRAVAWIAGVSETAVRRGVADLQADALPIGQVRRAGGGRPPAEELDPELLPALLGLVEPDERGDPCSPLRWTTKSLRNLAAELTRQGRAVSAMTVGRLLKANGFSLQSTAKMLEGAQHPDRDAQFRYLNDQVKKHQAAGQPVISVDAKKKEQVGLLPMAGREWRPSGQPIQVEDHSFFAGPRVDTIESLNARYRRAIKARGHFPTEQAALKCLYLVTRSLDPTGTGRARWAMRWKPALNAFAITFGDRFPAAETY